MAANSPVFPIPEPHHFSDYGFDPQIDFFQVLGEAKRHQKRSEAWCFRSIDTLHFKLQKPISKDDPFQHHHLSKKTKKKNNKSSASASAASKKRLWWKSALLFIKSRWAHHPSSNSSASSFGPSSISGAIYITDPLPGPASIRPSSGPLSGYVNLRELNMDQSHRISAASPMPIYLGIPGDDYETHVVTLRSVRRRFPRFC